ncbi:MAG: MFS transporter [Gemmatimonadetes bacterium]|nr:MFS transporter [Gemmatimonadota bacterium]
MTANLRVTPRLLLFFTGNVLFAAGLFAHAFLYNFYLEAIGLSETVMGGAAASLTAGGLAALWPAGWLVDRRGPAFAYGLSALIAGAGLLAGAWAENPIAVYAAGFTAGLGTSSWRVAMGPLIMRWSTGRTRTRAFSWNVALLVASGAGWTALSASAPAWMEARFAISGLDGIRMALAGSALGTLAALLIVPAIREGRPADAPVGPASNGDLRFAQEPVTDGRVPAPGAAGRLFPGARWLPGLIVIVAVWMLASALVLPFFNIYFQRSHDLSIARVGAIFAVAQLITAVVLAASAELAARTSPRHVLIGWAMLLAPALFLLGQATSRELAIGLYILAGFVPPATNPLIDQLLLERAPPGRHGTVSTWRNAATDLSGLVGASAGGMILERTSFAVLYFVAAGVAVAGALGLAFRLNGGSRRGPSPA